MKYAHVERERRYLLLGKMYDLEPIKVLNIHDRYVIESTLRLRSVVEEGKPTVFKLGQKIRVGEDHPLKIAHTTMYISEDEFNLLAALPADTLEKQRSILLLADSHIAVDEFNGELRGLLLAEVDLGSDGAAHPVLPFQELIEVTADDRLTGGKLARTSSAELQSILTEYGVT